MATEFKINSATPIAERAAKSANQNVGYPDLKKVGGGISAGTMSEIQRKASTGEAMQAPTAQKQQAYDAFQSYYTSEIQKKARSGERLDKPNEWKNSIYDEVSANLNPNDLAYYNSDKIMDRQQTGSDAYMSAMEKYLQQSKDGYMGTQEALLGKARDEQVAELKKALEDAVAEGEISVREAEAAFNENKGVIEQQAYNDSGRTRLAATDMGISNSAQMLGLQAGDNARATSMINKNMTERDRRVSDIKDRVNAIKNKSAIDTSMANANYNYGLAGAQGQADMQFSQQMIDMRNQEHNLNRSQQFALDQQGMSTQQQKQMAYLAQSFTLEQFAVQQGYNLTNMSVQQRYQLEQMYEGYLYNASLQNNQQSWQGSENSLDRSHQKDLQTGQQLWQTGENALDRSHQYNMQDYAQIWQSDENKLDRDATAKNIQTQIDAQIAASQSSVDEYSVALQREMAKYTSGTPEYALKQEQVSEATRMAEEEFLRKTQVDIVAERVAKGGPPEDPGPTPKLKDMMSGYERFRTSFSKIGIGISEKDLKAKYEKKYEEQVKLHNRLKAEYDEYMALFKKQ